MVSWINAALWTADRAFSRPIETPVLAGKVRAVSGLLSTPPSSSNRATTLNGVDAVGRLVVDNSEQATVSDDVAQRWQDTDAVDGKALCALIVTVGGVDAAQSKIHETNMAINNTQLERKANKFASVEQKLTNQPSKHPLDVEEQHNADKTVQFS